jgi:hypothetical protein
MTALRTSGWPTSSDANAWRAGLSAALKVPRQGEHDHLPEARVPGENDEAEKQRDAAKADLRDKQHAALVETVDEQPGVGTEQQDRSVARCSCQSEQESGMNELQHQESLGDGLDPGADQGQSLASDILAKIADDESAAKLLEPPIWFDRRPHG